MKLRKQNTNNKYTTIITSETNAHIWKARKHTQVLQRIIKEHLCIYKTTNL